VADLVQKMAGSEILEAEEVIRRANSMADSVYGPDQEQRRSPLQDVTDLSEARQRLREAARTEVTDEQIDQRLRQIRPDLFQNQSPAPAGGPQASATPAPQAPAQPPAPAQPQVAAGGPESAGRRYGAGLDDIVGTPARAAMDSVIAPALNKAQDFFRYSQANTWYHSRKNRGWSVEDMARENPEYLAMMMNSMPEDSPERESIAAALMREQQAIASA